MKKQNQNVYFLIITIFNLMLLCIINYIAEICGLNALADVCTLGAGIFAGSLITVLYLNMIKYSKEK